MMIITSRSEAFTHLLWILTQIEKQHLHQHTDKHAAEIAYTITQLQIAFENHTQDLQPALKQVKHLCEVFAKTKTIATDELASLTKLIDSLMLHEFKQKIDEKYLNPLARRSESEMAIRLLLQPTKAMMAVIKQVSMRIIHLLEHMEAEKSPLLLLLAHPNKHVTLGAITPPPSIADIKKILAANEPTQLPEIMYLHYQISLTIMRFTPIHDTPARMPVGGFSTLLQTLWTKTKNPLDFFGPLGIGNTNAYGNECRSYISDTAFYSSELYISAEDKSRGRQGSLHDDRSTHQLGLMLPQQDHFAQGLSTHTSTWVPDVKGQAANLQSQHVIDQIQNDGVYVSGFSGMTSLLLTQMELLNNFDQISLKQNYLSAVVAYIVGGGFHSLHEVIGPAQYVLKIVPEYAIQPPDTKDGKLAPPPNYYVFYHQQMTIDPEFAERRQMAWQRYLNFYEKIYLPAQNRQDHGKQEVPDVTLFPKEVEGVKLKIINTQEPSEIADIALNSNASISHKNSVSDSIKFKYNVAYIRLNKTIQQSSDHACSTIAADILVSIDKLSKQKNISLPTLKCLANCLDATAVLLNHTGAKRAEIHILVETYMLLLQELDHQIKAMTIAARKERCIKVRDNVNRFSQTRHSFLLNNIMYHGTNGVCIILDKSAQPFDSKIKQKMLKFAAFVSATQQVESSLKNRHG